VQEVYHTPHRRRNPPAAADRRPPTTDRRFCSLGAGVQPRASGAETSSALSNPAPHVGLATVLLAGVVLACPPQAGSRRAEKGEALQAERRGPSSTKSTKGTESTKGKRGDAPSARSLRPTRPRLEAVGLRGKKPSGLDGRSLRRGLPPFQRGGSAPRVWACKPGPSTMGDNAATNR